MATQDARIAADIDVWSQATELLRRFGDGADQEAAKLAEDQGAHGIAEAIGQLRRAVTDIDKKPALYLEFAWAFNVTGYDFIIDEETRNIGKDFNIGGLAALPARGPLVILNAKTTNDAFAEADAIWVNRGEYKSW